MKAAASGNPLILEEMTLRQEIRKLDTARYNHDREQYRIRDLIKQNTRYVDEGRKALVLSEKDAAAAADMPDKFAMTVAGEVLDKSKDAGAAIVVEIGKFADTNPNGGQVTPVGAYGPFKLKLRKPLFGDDFYLEIHGAQRYELSVSKESDPTGLAMRVRNTVATMLDDPSRVSGLIDKAAAEIPKLEAQIAPWADEARFDQVKARHEEVLGQLRPKPKPAAPQTDDKGPPKGGPSAVKLGNTLAGFRQTDTLSFRRWFGKSKVVDSDGQPLRVFHGTNSNFDRFSKAELGSATGARSAKLGFFFTSDPEVGSSYADNENPYDTKLVRLLGKPYQRFNEAILRALGRPSQIPSGQNVLPVYLRIENPLEVDFEGEGPSSDKPFSGVIERAKAEGHDGVIIRNTFDPGFSDYPGQNPDKTADLFIAFEPTQVKSATGNTGAFDASNPSILADAVAPATVKLTDQERARASRVIAGIVERVAGRINVDLQLADTITFEEATGETYREDMSKFAAAGGRVSKTAGGYFAGNQFGDALIKIALADPKFDPISTAFHEAYHRVETHLMTQDEFAEISTEAATDQARQAAAKVRGLDPVKDAALLQALPGYEARAIAFEGYALRAMRFDALGPIPAALRRFFVKLRRIMREVRDYLLRQPYGGALKDAFERAYQGEFGQRPVQSFRDVLAYGNALAPETRLTPAFKAWFAGSKVVDDKGRPLRVYHGTVGNFDTFDQGRARLNSKHPTAKFGFYFSADPGIAASFQQSMDAWPPRPEPLPNASVMPVYLSIKRPKELTVEQFLNKGALGRASDGVLDAIKEGWINDGYDGLLIKGGEAYADQLGADEFTADTWVAFKPSQIKSAIANPGTFDPNTDSILGSVITNEDTDPFAEDGAPRRQRAMWNALQVAPLDRAIRLPFEIFGALDQKGEYRAGARLYKKAAHIITGARFADNSRFHFMNPILHRARAGLVDRYGLSDEYVQRDRQRALDERGILSQVPELIHTLQANDVGPAEARMLHAVLTGERTPEPQWRGVSEPIRNAIDDLGQEAVELGLISAESFERNRGAYLHRVYLKHERDTPTLLRWINEMRSSRRKRIIGSELKGRGLFKQVPMARLKDAEGHIPRLGTTLRLFDRENDDGQVIERKYLRPGEAAPEGDFIDRGEWEVRAIKGHDLVLWRDYTKAERTRMGEITDARYTIAKTYMLMAHDLSVGRFYRDIAQNADWTRDTEPPDGEHWAEAGDYNRHWADPSIEWVRVPDTKIPKSNTFRYAALAAKFVRAEIWRDINELEILNKAQTWQKLVTAWKISKTALSPVVHMNNVMSNVVLMDMSGVGAADLLQGLRSLVTSDDLYHEAESHGAFGADQASNEIRKNVLEPVLHELEREMQGNQEQLESRIGIVGKVITGIYRAVKYGGRKMIDLYQVEDEVFRMALYARRRQQGIEPQEAADEAREQFIDYDIRAPWVNFVRRTLPVLPFIAYTYRAVPIIARTVATRPWKIAKYLAISYALQSLAYALLPGDPDKERRSMQEDQQGYTWIGAPRMLRLPWGDKYGNPMMLDIRRWIPAGDVFDLGGQGATGIPFLPAPLQLGGPLMMGFELALNRDAFTGKDIVNTITDDWWDTTAKVTDWAWKQVMPSAAFVPGSYYWQKVANAVKGARDGMGKPFDIPSALASSAGVKVSPLDVQENMRIWGLEFDKVENTLKSEMSRAARDRSRGMISLDEFNAQRGKLVAKMQNLNAKRRYVFSGEK
jgi:hypothetical protein